MRTHTSDYKNGLKGIRETLTILTKVSDSQEISESDLKSIKPILSSDLLKSVMKELDLESKVDIPLNTELNLQLGIKVRNDEVEDERDNFDFINYGNYIVYESNYQVDSKIYKITCYDKMLFSMVDYETPKEYVLTQDEEFIENKPYYELINDEYVEYTGARTGNPSQLGLYEYVLITFPITIRSYINKIASHLGLEFANKNDTFANYDKEIQNELYLSTGGGNLGYTFRDVLDELSQATASNICINENDQLEVRYITDTEDTIDENYLKAINVEFGEKYGPVNSIVLSRSAESDSVYLSDDESVAENGLCEIKISNNQIMNFNDRDTYLPDILEKLDGLEYYLNDFSSTGITYLEVCDMYNISIGNDTYNCLMLNDKTNITSGLSEDVFTEMPPESITDYKKADKTDRKINQAYLMVDKQNQVITSVVNQIGDRSQKQTTITQDIDGIASQVQDIPTITTENEGTGVLLLYDLANTLLISLKIHPTNQDIIGLLASNLITVRNGLKVHSKSVTFLSQSEKVYYSLPDNLYYLDNDTYDEFIYDGKNERAYVIRRVAVDSLGNKSMLETPYEEEYPYQDIIVEGGNYNVFMSSYPTAYIYVKAMIKNDYTDFFATSYEVGSKITQSANQILSEVAETYETKAGAETQYSQIKQTTDEISLEVGHKVDDEDYTKAQIVAKINDNTSQVKIAANNVNLQGYVTASDLAGTGTTVINGSNITTGSLSADRIKSGQIEVSGYTEQRPFLTVGTGSGSEPKGAIAWDNGITVYDYRVSSGTPNAIIKTEYSGGYAQLRNSTCSAYYFENLSLAEKKQDFELLKSGLEILKDIDIYKFRYKGEDGKKKIGLVIGDNYKYSQEVTSKNNNSVDLYSFVSVCCKAIQEQQEQIEKLQKELQSLKEGDK